MTIGPSSMRMSCRLMAARLPISQKVMVGSLSEGSARTFSIEMSEVKTVGGREIPTRIEMRNLESRSKTVVITHSAEDDVPIDEKYFNPTRFYR